MHAKATITVLHKPWDKYCVRASYYLIPTDVSEVHGISHIFFFSNVLVISKISEFSEMKYEWQR